MSQIPKEGAFTGPLLRTKLLNKSFSGVHALKDVSIELAPGEVHGLVGENGAGKSTLIKVLAGAYVPDSGTIEVAGQAVSFGDPRASQRAGIAVIYQELTIVPDLSTLENVFLGNIPRRGPWMSRKRMERKFDELDHRLGGLPFTAGQRAGSMSVANQQIVEIMRALVADHRIVIMDEPTASLGPIERDRLYDIVRTLRSQGVTIVYVSHDLDEVLDLSDRVSVMRNGRLAETAPAAKWRKSELVTAMLGRSIEEIPRPSPYPGGPEVLRIEGFTVPGVLNDVSFTLRRGEVLGLAGLVGSGRTELLRALAGANPTSSGRMFIDGKEINWPGSVTRALALGIAMAPEDRKDQGLVLSLSAAENVVLTDYAKVATGPWISKKRMDLAAAKSTQNLGFDSTRLSSPAGMLSGGNQQKLVVGKWLHREPRILLMDEFTRGIDLGAKAEMMAAISQLSEQGMAVIAVSSELEEVLQVSHRVLVIGRGRIVADLESNDELTPESLLSRIFQSEDAA